MRLGAYTFSCQLQDEALLPEFKGSTLRGGLGHALKRVVCALRRKSCGDCLLAPGCAYTFLFEADKNGDAQSRRPHPYLLSAPEDPRRHWRAGDQLDFTLTLFGKANDYLPHLVYAFKELGEAGLGKKQQSNGRLLLQKVSMGQHPVWQGDKLQPPPQLPELTLTPALPGPLTSLALRCHTPLRLKYENHLQHSLPFHLLIRAALRRISSLEAAYGDGEPALDYKGLAARAADVKVAGGDCRWREIRRYSSRQKKEMLIGGMEGEMHYRGDDLSEFLPLLRYCEQVHLGKQTTFGLGRISVEER